MQCTFRYMYPCYLHPKMQTCFSCQFQILWPLPVEKKVHMIRWWPKYQCIHVGHKTQITRFTWYECWLGWLSGTAWTSCPWSNLRDPIWGKGARGDRTTLFVHWLQVTSSYWYEWSLHARKMAYQVSECTLTKRTLHLLTILFIVQYMYVLMNLKRQANLTIPHWWKEL